MTICKLYIYDYNTVERLIVYEDNDSYYLIEKFAKGYEPEKWNVYALDKTHDKRIILKHSNLKNSKISCFTNSHNRLTDKKIKEIFNR